jgi:hypothetical protein
MASPSLCHCLFAGFRLVLSRLYPGFDVSEQHPEREEERAKAVRRWRGQDDEEESDQ